MFQRAVVLWGLATADGGSEGLPALAVLRQRAGVVVVAAVLAVPATAAAAGVPVLPQPPGAPAAQARHLRPEVPEALQTCMYTCGTHLHIQQRSMHIWKTWHCIAAPS